MGVILLIGLVLLQFVRPSRNRSKSKLPTDITNAVSIPANVQHIISVACSDCHSNNTRYPWYAEIQPVAWWLNDHIVDGKKDLNFSEFAKYRIRKQYVKFEQIIKLVKDNNMPLASYTWIHKDAILTPGQKQAITSWSTSIRDSIKAHYPPDSLVRKN